MRISSLQAIALTHTSAPSDSSRHRLRRRRPSTPYYPSHQNHPASYTHVGLTVRRCCSLVSYTCLDQPRGHDSTNIEAICFVFGFLFARCSGSEIPFWRSFANSLYYTYPFVISFPFYRRGIATDDDRVSVLPLLVSPGHTKLLKDTLGHLLLSLPFLRSISAFLEKEKTHQAYVAMSRQRWGCSHFFTFLP